MKTRELRFAAISVALLLCSAVFAMSQDNDLNQGFGNAVVTVLAAKQGAGVASPVISQKALALKVDGKPAEISKWEHLQGSNAPIQLVVLIDDAAGGSLGNQFGEISQFIKGLPQSAEVAVAYMDNGRADLASPLSKDRAAVTRELRIPKGQPGISGSPYFCLSDLAHQWPSHDPQARRIVVMITNGVDNYEVRYNPEDPYLQAAIHDAVRSRISVYSIYWQGEGSFGRSWYAASAGQNLLAELTAATGGYSYWQGAGNPVSFQPYFNDLNRRLQNQYRLSFVAPLPHGPRVETLSLHVSNADTRVIAPQQVFVGHPAGGHGTAQGD